MKYQKLFALTVLFLGCMLFCSASSHSSEAAESEVIDLFNGIDFTGWYALPEMKHENTWLAAGGVSLNKKDKKLFDIEEGEGILVNGKDGRTVNILSKREHGDCQLHIEFCVPEGSNSGVYFQGQYEIQVFDSYGKKNVQYSDCSAIYARYDSEKNTTYEGHPPRQNASKSPGEWQSFDIVFQAPKFDENGQKTTNAKFILVKHNGVIVHENVELTGPTRASLNDFNQEKYPESAKGPLMLQGDHGPVAYRNIKLIPLH